MPGGDGPRPRGNPDELVGAPLSRVQEIVERTHGPLVDQQLLGDGPDRIDALSTFGDVEVRTAIVAMRDSTGFADHARLLLAMRPAVRPGQGVPGR